MPDNRHVVIAISDSPHSLSQLYLADTKSGEIRPLGAGTLQRDFPAISPDGSKLAFMESSVDFDIVSVDLQTAAVTPLIATPRLEVNPAWANRDSVLVYSTNRNGDIEIWFHSAGSDRPLISPKDFPPGTTKFLWMPVLSPDSDRVIYTRVEESGAIRLWISAVAGGPPVLLVKNEALIQNGSWSPDGAWFVYWNGFPDRLEKVKTTGAGEPVVVKSFPAWDVTGFPANIRAPLWSPAGDWILIWENGFKLISPDGAVERKLSSPGVTIYAFSSDGKTLYGIRRKDGAG
jgi:Tol biopolymer transport system component